MTARADSAVKEAAVVLVHGLFSSAQTWGDIVARIGEDPELRTRCNVFTMEYDSPKARLSPLREIPDYDTVADFMRTYLDTQVAAHQKVVLISHSQGGLIVQRYLARMIQKGHGLQLHRIKAVVMLACPNSGSEIAILLRRFAKFWQHPQEEELRPINRKVNDTQQIVLEHIRFARGLDAQNCHIDMHLYAGMSDNIVKPASASGMFPEVKALPGDHFSILEAGTADALVFRALRGHLLAVLELRSEITDRPVVRHNVTALPTVVIDRQSELRRTLEGLASPHLIVSISGLGGIGKSTLAKVVARTFLEAQGTSGAPRFSAVVWCDMTTEPASLDALIDAIADVTNHRYLRTLPMPGKADQAVALVNRESCLIIIDDFAPPVDPADRDYRDIRAFLLRIDPARTKVLVTSRVPHLPDAWLVDIGGLDDSARAELAGAEGRRLGISAIIAGDDDLLREYLDATSGNPLAIQLTAAQMRYGGDDLRSSINRLRNAADSDIFGPIFDRSWNELLASHELARTIIMAIALHPANASNEAIAAVLGLRVEELSRQIPTLVRTFLVDIEEPGERPRLRLHPLTRAYVLRKLLDQPEHRTRIEERLIDYYRVYATKHSDIYTDTRRVGLLEAERDNILRFAATAFDRAGVSGARPHCLDVIEFAESMVGFLSGRGYWLDQIRLCRNAADAAEVAGEPLVRARQFAFIGRVQVSLGRMAEAGEYLEHSAAALPDEVTDEDCRETLRLEGHIASRRGELAVARSLFQRILDSAPLTADNEGRPATLVELGVCAMREGEFGVARARFDEARRLDVQLGATEGVAVSLSHLGDAYFETGENEQARLLFEQGLEFADEVHRPSSLGRCHLGLAKISVLDRRYAQGMRHAQAAGEAFARLGVPDMMADIDLIIDNLSSLAGGDERPCLAGLLSRCRAVILDLDDTLVATAKSRWPVLRETAAYFGVELAVETIRSAWGQPFDVLLDTIVPTLDHEEFVTAYHRKLEVVHAVATTGAVQLVKALHRRGLPRLIVGSGKRSLIRNDLKQVGLDEFFAPGDIFGYEQTRAHKPDPRVLREPLRKLAERGIDRSELVSVGDSVRDLEVATGNGVPFIAVSTGLEGRADFVNAGLSERLIVNDLSQLRLWL
ncbi:alpha/beta fold hydrolase [Nocardia sp. NPDC052566]|uniref:alpha/beta fold hydrolase n=1 Tax=Nocardia sp. NPDC052566 TaxID=3364330 RepID=UPI0037C758F6